MNSDILSLLAQIRNLVSNIIPSNPVEIPKHDYVVMNLFGRSISLFDGIIALLEKNLVEESVILGRSLFKEALWLAEINDLGAERIPVLLWWINNSIKEKKWLVKEAQKLNLERAPEHIFKQLESEEKSLREYQKRHRVGKLKNFQSTVAAAKMYGRETDYWTYHLSHEMVHGSDAAFAFRRNKTESGKILLRTSAPGPFIFHTIACFSARSIVQAAASAASIFEWKVPDDLGKALSELENL